MTAPNRRWPRYSLRTLFVLVTVLGIGYYVYRERLRLQAEAFDAELWRDLTPDGETIVAASANQRMVFGMRPNSEQRS